MAVVVDAFVGRCLNLLDQLVTDEVVMILGVKDELLRLQEKLDFIKDLLVDAERRRIQDRSVNRWLSKLRDIMYDADDVVDLCRIKGRELLQGQATQQISPSSSVRPPRRRRFFSFSSCFRSLSTVPLRHEVGKEIQKINQRLEDVSKDRIMFSLQHVDAPAVSSTQVNTRQTSPLPSSDFVGKGVRMAADRLVDSLVKSENENVLVFAIVGLGGIGKTTLAQKIYNHKKVQSNFHERLWVCVSQNYSEIELMKQMIRSVGGDHGHAQTKAELQPLLRSTLAGSRFLLVLDDVWQADVWEDLLQAPLERAGAFHSRVLITTRNEDVSRSMRVIHTHRVDKLPADDGWELLSKSVFGDEADEDEQDLQEIGVKIVEKCDGLPLAIKAIAGILRTKDRSKREWENVCKSHAWNVKGELPEAVRGALYLSYEDLPSHLKQCFLYCSLFPEDYSFFRLDLIRWWVAEGFITAQGDSLLEDTAEDCYNNLISRNLLNYDPKYLDGSQCVMHDLIRSIALSLAQSESHIVDGTELTAVSSLKLRRLSLQAKEAEVILNSVHTPLCLRTLHMVQCSKIEMHDLSQRFKRLRVLSLSDSTIEIIPESISNLQHLRFLDLDRTNIPALPESLGSLTNLQFLQLSGCKSLQSLPKTITQLSSLRRLGFYRAPVTHVPVGIGKLNHLIDLEGFVVGLNDAGDSHQSGKDQLGCGLDELQPMVQLRNLSILRLDRILIGGIQPLKDKPFLKRLRLEWNEEVGQSLSSDSERTQQVCEDLAPPPSLEILFMSFFNGVRFPQWISMLPNLTHLSIYTFFSCRELPPLGQLPQLKILRIEGAPAIVTIGPEFLGCDRKRTAFPRLEQLVLIALPNLEKWTLCDANEGDGGKTTAIKLLPCLQKLQIFFCPKLRALPEGLQQAAALEACWIHGADSLREIENIPSVEMLTVRGCPCLESISNLPALREMTIVHSSRILKAVEKMERLRSLSLYLEDAFTECLPEWLLRLIRLLELETLTLHCNAALMEKCREGGEYWSLLGNIADFSVKHNI